MNNVQVQNERCSIFGSKRVKMQVEKLSKKDDLRARLLRIAGKHIEKHGYSALRARDITAEAGSALGGLYTVFDDLDALVVAVNSETLQTLDEVVLATVTGTEPPAQQLLMLGQRYLDFARQNPRRWRALFEHRLPEGTAFPDSHIANQARLLMHIAKPLAQLQPGLSEVDLMIRARTMFAAVHGIVSISLDNRFVGLATETLDQEIDRFIRLLLAGIGVDQGALPAHP
jgi:AcrR family transcriptional regulator